MKNYKNYCNMPKEWENEWNDVCNRYKTRCIWVKKKDEKTKELNPLESK